MRRFPAFFAIMLAFCAFATAQEEAKPVAMPKSELFGGFTYEHAGFSGIAAPTLGAVTRDSAGLTGFNIDFSRYFVGNFGVTVEVSRVTNNRIDATGVECIRTSFMGGPTYRLHRYGFFSPSVHVLGGVDRQTLNVPTFAATVTFQNTDFAVAGGGTLDGNLSRHLAVRLAQVDYLYTHHYDTGQSSFRYSGGLVVRF